MLGAPNLSLERTGAVSLDALQANMKMQQQVQSLSVDDPKRVQNRIRTRSKGARRRSLLQERRASQVSQATIALPDESSTRHEGEESMVAAQNHAVVL